MACDAGRDADHVAGGRGMTDGERRKLAAIMSTDMVGFSALT